MNTFNDIKPTIMIDDIIKGNLHTLLLWTYAYALQNSQFSMYFAVKYLVQIANDGIEYPKNLLAEISAELPTKLQLYIPKHLYLPDLSSIESASNGFKISPLENFIFGSIYWLRYLQPQKLQLEDDKFSSVDLYLVTANSFERYPGRKLLSYYNDKDLYMKFGRVGKFFFPKNYPSKMIQLDGIVGMSLQPFGYFTVQNWTRPINLLYHYSEIPLGKENIKIFDLDTLINSYSDYIPTYMPLLRLGIQIESNWSLISDKEAWDPLISFVNSNSKLLRQEYLKYKNSFITNISIDTIITIPDNFESLEQKYTTCLLCEKSRPLDDFSLCGHGTCITCQSLLGTAKCPFCNEHFVADNLNDESVRILQSDVRKDFTDRINQINKLKQDRNFKFDWANGEVVLF
jgi:hypothetical protein